MNGPDLFGEAPSTAAQLREERRFGLMDALTGLPLGQLVGNSYRSSLSGARLGAYDAGYAEGRRKLTQSKWELRP